MTTADLCRPLAFRAKRFLLSTRSTWSAHDVQRLIRSGVEARPKNRLIVVVRVARYMKVAKDRHLQRQIQRHYH